MRTRAALFVASSTLLTSVLAESHHYLDDEHTSNLVRKQNPWTPPLGPPIGAAVQQQHSSTLDAHIASLCSTSLMSSERCGALNRRANLDPPDATENLNAMCNIIADKDCSDLLAEEQPQTPYIEGFRKALKAEMQSYCSNKVDWACEMLKDPRLNPRSVSGFQRESHDYLTRFLQQICKSVPEDACMGTSLAVRDIYEPGGNLTTYLDKACIRVSSEDCKQMLQKKEDHDSIVGIFADNLTRELPLLCRKKYEGACSAMESFGLTDSKVKRQLPSMNATSTTASGLHVQTVTKTIIRTTAQPCGLHIMDDPNEVTVFMANISGTPVQMTGDTQLIGPNTMAIIAAKPMGTMYPIIVDNAYLGDLLRFSMDQQVLQDVYGEVMGMPLNELQDEYSHLDWDGVGRLGALLQNHRKDLGGEIAMRHAIAFSLHDAKSAPPQPHLTASVNNDDADPNPIVSISGTTFHMTASTQTHNGDVFVATTTSAPFDVHWAAEHDQRPPSCKKPWSHACRVEKCMLRHHKPINITTVFPAVLRREGEDDDDSVHLSIGYFTHRTSITTAHWGITEKEKIYYPSTTSWTTTMKHGTPTRVQTMIRQTPPSKGLGLIKSAVVARNSDCYDYDSCCEACAKHPGQHFFRLNNWMMWLTVLGMLAWLSLLGFCAMCCLGACLRGHRNRKKDPSLSRWEAIPIIGHKFRSEKVDPAAGSDVAQVVEVVPVAAAAAGGAAAANTADAGQGAGDGRGTLGRQAEEGRGRISFADAGQSGQAANAGTPAAPATVTEGSQADPSTATGQKVVTSSGPPTTVVTNPEGAVTGSGQDAAPQVRPGQVEVHRVDGAADAHSGSEIADMGSMRGRKRGRTDLKGLFLGPPA